MRFESGRKATFPVQVKLRAALEATGVVFTGGDEPTIVSAAVPVGRELRGFEKQGCASGLIVGIHDELSSFECACFAVLDTAANDA